MLYQLDTKHKISTYNSLNSSFIKRAKKNLILGFSNKSGHNFYGRITVFTKGGGMKKKLRILDYRRILYSKGVVISKERDWLHTGYVGCVCYYIGLFSYVILSKNFFIGSKWEGFNLFKKGSSNFLLNFNVGTYLNNIEIIPGKGAVLARAAGTSAFVYSKSNNFIVLKLRSGLLKKLSNYCIGSLGIVSNSFHKYSKKKNAGANRILGNRPKVRGVAMNPVDHPHGGGEGKKSQPALPRTPWGKPSKWVKTKKIR